MSIALSVGDRGGSVMASTLALPSRHLATSNTTDMPNTPSRTAAITSTLWFSISLELNSGCTVATITGEPPDKPESANPLAAQE